MSGIPAGPGTPAINVDPTTPVGMIRLLITDLSEDAPLFTDAQLEAFLTAEGNVVKRAAASALTTIARSEALVSKRITTQDLSTDGPAVAKELRASAAELRAEALTEQQAAADDGIEIVPLWQFPTAPHWGDHYLSASRP